MKRVLFANALSLLGSSAVAADADSRRATATGASDGQDRPSNNLPNWHERTLAATGRHWLDRRWAVNYAANHIRQGNAGSRSGIPPGVQYIF